MVVGPLLEDRVAMQGRGVRQECVQKSLDTRIRRPGIDGRAAKLVHHVGVAEFVQRQQGAQAVEAQRGEAVRLDRRHIPAAALDVQDVDRFARQVRHGGLDRAVAAPVQHETRSRPSRREA
ncbi:hypothetical protein ACTMTJ_41040 [Phytohabitans sp. LJ34]|uniref:hypothetical protein n=1 Tax=Phytohabitans sp. LJ34 TaxID=3452217 RepID=UPI003F8AC188